MDYLYRDLGVIGPESLMRFTSTTRLMCSC